MGFSNVLDDVVVYYCFLHGAEERWTGDAHDNCNPEDHVECGDYTIGNE